MQGDGSAGGSNSGVTYKNGYRTADGKFASPTGSAPKSGLAAENNVANVIEGTKEGWEVLGKQVRAELNEATRVLDLVVRSPSGRIIGIEVKSGSARLTPECKLQPSSGSWPLLVTTA
jgi:hypothetical protein